MGIAYSGFCRHCVLFLGYSMWSDLSGLTSRIFSFSDDHLFPKQTRDHQRMYGFMFEQSQVQNYLLQQLPVPYALLDGNGMIIWSNDAFHKMWERTEESHCNRFFPNLNRNLLPSDVMHSISHIEYKKKCKEGDKEKEQTLFYKVEMNRIRVEDFSDENDNSCSRQMLKDNDLIAVYFF